MRRVLVFLLLCASGTVAASSGPPVSIETRARGAQRIVVGTIVDVHSRFQANEFGDRLIVTEAVVEVVETLKGPPSTMLSMTVEGGTVGELTLHVSDMPAVSRGERAMLFLNGTPAGTHTPHGRGLGVLKLDAAGRVADSADTLADLRGRIRSALK
jgi:hypothetical protein